MEVEKSSQNPYMVSVYPRYSASIFLLKTFRLTREMFVKARQRVIVVASQRKAFNQLDSSDTGESLAGGIFAIVQ